MITTLHAELIRQGMNIVILITTDISENDIDPKGYENDIFLTDRTTALSLNRANGGVTLLDDQIIIKKSTMRYLINLKFYYHEKDFVYYFNYNACCSGGTFECQSSSI